MFSSQKSFKNQNNISWIKRFFFLGRGKEEEEGKKSDNFLFVLFWFPHIFFPFEHFRFPYLSVDFFHFDYLRIAIHLIVCRLLFQPGVTLRLFTIFFLLLQSFYTASSSISYLSSSLSHFLALFRGFFLLLFWFCFVFQFVFKLFFFLLLFFLG